MWHCIAVGRLMCTAALNSVWAHLDVVTLAAPGQWLIGLLNLNISDRNLFSWYLFLKSNSYIEIYCLPDQMLLGAFMISIVQSVTFQRRQCKCKKKKKIYLVAFVAEHRHPVKSSEFD
jgi:hypothetical protein